MDKNDDTLKAQGIFVFTLFIDGEFIDIKVNELIPSYKNNYTYAHTPNNEI